MEPPKQIVRSFSAPPLLGTQGGTGKETQGVLPSDKDYKKEISFSTQPAWGEKVLPGLKKAGLGLGCVVFGVLSIGWIPVAMVAYSVGVFGLLLGKMGQEHNEEGQIVGTVGKVREKIGDIVCYIGLILMGPVCGLAFCVAELSKTKYR